MHPCMDNIWKGAIAFGLVNIPVQLHAAVRSAEKLSFRQLDKKHHKPITVQRVSSADHKAVPWKDIVKGFEISRGKFVIMEDEDFAAAAVKMSRVLEMTEFVPAESIDPRYFDTPYFLVPVEGGEKAYALFRDALAETEKVGIGTFALRQKQHLAAVKPMGDALVLELMRFEEELVDPSELKFPSAKTVKVRPQERDMARKLIENLAEPFDPSKYRDEYQDKLHAIIKAKAKGRKLAIVDAREPEQTKVVDLVSRLQESLAASAGGKRGGRKTPENRGHKTTKTARRKTA
ncbi:MAG: repair protein [Gemmatimonadetes bacterium]|nr:repair protein [Gemmatimonadota bacterium]